VIFTIDTTAGLAMQAFRASQLLLWASEPRLGGIDDFLKRQKMIHDNVNVICGIGLSMADDAARLLSSQYVFIGGRPDFAQTYLLTVI
jgi:hypothetical protein